MVVMGIGRIGNNRVNASDYLQNIARHLDKTSTSVERRGTAVSGTKDKQLPLSNDDFPYLLTHVHSTVYHIMLVPRDKTRNELLRSAIEQVRMTRLDSCLVFGEEDCIYISTDDLTTRQSNTPPRGGIILTDMIDVHPLLQTGTELDAACNRLRDEMERRKPEGFSFKEGTKFQGRDPSGRGE